MISSAPTQPTMVGTLTSGNSPGAQLPSMVCWIVLSNPSRAAAKQQTTSPNRAEKIPIPLDIPTLLRMSQLDLARILTENIVKNGYFQDIATGRNAAFTTGRSSWGLLYLIFA